MDLLLDIVLTITALGVVMAYARLQQTHFRSDGIPRGAYAISAAVVTTAGIDIALLWLLPQPIWAQLLGLVVIGLSLWLFKAAIDASRTAELKLAFDAANPHGLVTTGPYRYVRHPFYTSYMLFWIGLALATWSAWALLPLAVITVIYVLAALGEEQKFARTDMAPAYVAYRKTAGLFWPKFPGTGG